MSEASVTKKVSKLKVDNFCAICLILFMVSPACIIFTYNVVSDASEAKVVGDMSSIKFKLQSLHRHKRKKIKKCIAKFIFSYFRSLLLLILTKSVDLT